MAFFRMHGELICPYGTNETCKNIQKQLLDARPFFKCIKCSKRYCPTYSYSLGSNICWPCGLKTPLNIKNISVSDNEDLT